MLRNLYDAGVKTWNRYLDKNHDIAVTSDQVVFRATVELKAKTLDIELPNGDYLGRVFYTEEKQALEKVSQCTQEPLKEKQRKACSHRQSVCSKGLMLDPSMYLRLAAGSQKMH